MLIDKSMTAVGEDSDSGAQVLVVEDDSATLAAYGELLTSLGYEPVLVNNVPTALRLLGQQTSIGIVLTDLHLPGMGGMELLEEVSCRFASLRPIVMIVVTGHASLDIAVQAMRFQASDFLTKPVSAANLSAALRRAARSLGEQQARVRLRSDAEGEPGPVAEASVAPQPLPAEQVAASDAELLAVARTLKRTSDQRAEYFEQGLFADPCWDILLELTAARIQGQSVPVSSACTATHLPFSTALRYVRSLVDMGMVRRWKDPRDRRRDLLNIEDAAFQSMKTLLADVRRKMVGN